MAKLITHYDNLNVSRNAPASVIKAAYKALSQHYHPDKYTGEHEEALRIMKAINSAYAVLSDATKKAMHDQWIDTQEREHAAYETQRIITIISKAYADPPAIVQKNIPKHFSVSQLFWKVIHSMVNTFRCLRTKIQRSSAINNKRVIKIRVVKKILGLVALIGMIWLAVTFYLPKSKTTVTTVNQNVVSVLKKAKYWVDQGQVIKALPLYLQLAMQGNADAQFYTGLLYINGHGIAKDEHQAVNWLGKAAKQGHKEAQSKLGFMYATGKGVVKNDSLAVYWCYKAAEHGDVFAQYNLGLIYEKGQGVAQDNSLAFSWYSKAAAQGDAQAQYNLGVMYEKGVGVAKDSKQAATFYREAAKQGLAAAVTALKKSRVEKLKSDDVPDSEVIQ
jgi:hypothetical protein